MSAGQKVDTMNDNIPLFAAAAGILGLLIAYALYKKVNDVKIDNKTVGDITQEIQDGAMAFLKAEYRVLSVSYTHLTLPTKA